MVGPGNERYDRSRAGLRPKIGFAVATLVLLVSILAMAFGERRGFIYLILALLMYWQAWALTTTGSNLRKRIASRWIPLSVFSASGVALLAIGFIRLANGRTSAALVSFGGALLTAALITWILWVNRRGRSA